MTNSPHHLSDDQILTAVVDVADLAPEADRHLTDCQQCRHRIHQLRAELQTIGHLSRQMLPPPMRRPLPTSQCMQPLGLFPVRRTALVAGMAAILFFAALWIRPLIQPPQPPISTAQFSTELYFLDDIINDETLPDHYQEIIVASNATFSDEFLEYVTGSE
jgi:hypothetical protein